MKKGLKLLLAGLTAVALSGCERFEYHPYSIKLDADTDTNTKTIRQLEESGLTTPFKFAFITDTQGALDETAEALDIIRRRGDIDFIIHGGDMTDFGLPKEYLWTCDMLGGCGLPYLAVIGNHDCLANGEDTFDWLFGPENFSLNVGCAHIVGLNTVALEYDYSRPVPDFKFIEHDCDAVAAINAETPDSLTHTIVVMHSRPYDEQFNNNVAKPFNYYMTRYPGMDRADGSEGTPLKGFCINGHNHYTDVKDIFDNGILYYQCANMAKRQFFVFTITDDGYEYEVVEF